MSLLWIVTDESQSIILKNFGLATDLGTRMEHGCVRRTSRSGVSEERRTYILFWPTNRTKDTNHERIIKFVSFV